MVLVPQQKHAVNEQCSSELNPVSIQKGTKVKSLGTECGHRARPSQDRCWKQFPRPQRQGLQVHPLYFSIDPGSGWTLSQLNFLLLLLLYFMPCTTRWLLFKMQFYRFNSKYCSYARPSRRGQVVSLLCQVKLASSCSGGGSRTDRD